MKQGKKVTTDFVCTYCKQPFHIDKYMDIHNRNHCPSCLWSKHLDDKNAGDRKSKCKGAMVPIGLTFKKEPPNKYGPSKPGELMIIHECKQCGQLRINRIAADDSTEAILAVFEQSQKLDKETRQRLAAESIHLLTKSDEQEIKTQLFGKTQGD